MCGRYTHYLPWSEIHRLYRLTLDADRARNTKPRYNITPKQEVLFVTADGDSGGHKLREGLWWLVPFWAKEVGNKYPTFNARVEDVEKKPSFRDSWKAKRCLIPADGFYEWTKNAEDGGKDPWFIHLPDKQPYSFAGLWAYNSALDVTSCTIMTMPAAEPVTKLHTRQPAILRKDAYDAWLDPATPIEQLKPLLYEKNLDADLQFHRVDRQINSNKFNGGAEAIQPLKAA